MNYLIKIHVYKTNNCMYYINDINNFPTLFAIRLECEIREGFISSEISRSRDNETRSNTK